MADMVEEQQTFSLTVDHGQPEEIIAISSSGNVVDGSSVTDDILQQALDEVSSGYGQVAYTTGDIHSVSTHPLTITSQNADGSLGIGVGDGSAATYALVNISDAQQVAVHNGMHTVQAADGSIVEHSHTMEEPIFQSGLVGISENHIVSAHSAIPEQAQYAEILPSTSQHLQTVQHQQTVHESMPSVQPESVESRDQDAQLGTSANPIRIIQQGNQYTSLQQLTPEQLSQIMQVLQQQQLLKSTEKEGSSVLFNPQTQTRIVYKVIYPSQLHGKSANQGEKPSQTTVAPRPGMRQIRVPTESVVVPVGATSKRTYRKRKHEDDGKEGPLLPKEEREARKKRKLRTRSGRISRPPKHMVKDYKHIHPVDFNDDPYDDSDGGYSDFKISDNEREDGSEKSRSKDTPYTAPYCLGSTKPKNWKCETCEKAYIGRAGLARHYRIYPGHGKLDLEDELGPEGVPGLAFTTMNGVDSDESRSSLINANTLRSPGSSNSKVSSTTDNASTSTGLSFKGALANSAEKTNAGNDNQTKEQTQVEKTPISSSNPPCKKEPRANIRTKQQYMQYVAPNKRKQRLKEVANQCDDEELAEALMPRLCRAVTPFEFLLMRAENGQPQPPLQDLLRDYAVLTNKVKALVTSQLKVNSGTLPTNADHQTKESAGGESSQKEEQVKVDEGVAACLGIPAGLYTVTRPPSQPEAVPLQYNFLTTADRVSKVAENRTMSQRRVVGVAPEELVVPPSGDKRQQFLQQLSSAGDPPEQKAGTAVSSDVMQQQNQQHQEDGQIEGSSNTGNTTSDNAAGVHSEERQHIVKSEADSISSQPSATAAEAAVAAAVSEVAAPQILSNGEAQTAVLTEELVSREHHLVLPSPLKKTSPRPSQPMVSLLNGNVIQSPAETNGGPSMNGSVCKTLVYADDPGHYEVSPSLPTNNNDVQLVTNGQISIEEGNCLVTEPQPNGDVLEPQPARILQTTDGLILIQNQDGSIQIHGQAEQGIPMEMVQALLAMDPNVETHAIESFQPIGEHA